MVVCILSVRRFAVKPKSEHQTVATRLNFQTKIFAQIRCFVIWPLCNVNIKLEMFQLNTGTYLSNLTLLSVL